MIKQLNWVFFWVSLVSAIFVTFAVGLISYFFSKTFIVWFKMVKNIGDRHDLANYPKLSEIVRVTRAICQHYRIPQPEIGIYPAGEINAFATGRRNNSIIAFSSNLVNSFTIEEIRGVIAHEMAHLINRDFMWILIVQGFCDIVVMVISSIMYWIRVIQTKKVIKKKKGFWAIFLFYFIWTLVDFIVNITLRISSLMFVSWFNRKRELKADEKGAEIIGVEGMIVTLQKLLDIENKQWIVDGLDLTKKSATVDLPELETEDKKTNDERLEPNSISLLKFNPDKKNRDWVLELFSTHPRLETRIARLKELKKQKGIF